MTSNDPRGNPAPPQPDPFEISRDEPRFKPGPTGPGQVATMSFELRRAERGAPDLTNAELENMRERGTHRLRNAGTGYWRWDGFDADWDAGNKRAVVLGRWLEVSPVIATADDPIWTDFEPPASPHVPGRSPLVAVTAEDLAQLEQIEADALDDISHLIDRNALGQVACLAANWDWDRLAERHREDWRNAAEAVARAVLERMGKISSPPLEVAELHVENGAVVGTLRARRPNPLNESTEVPIAAQLEPEGEDPCDVCAGDGRVPDPQEHRRLATRTCPACGGSGRSK